MNDDTSESIRLHLVEQGLQTLTHDWRNILNGINLRINSAKVQDDISTRDADLDEALHLISEGTTKISEISLKISTPSVIAIPYPIDFFLEDLTADLAKKPDRYDRRLSWENEPVSGKIMIDFNSAVRAFYELIDNTLRYLPEGEKLPISTQTEAGFLVISWIEKRRPKSDLHTWGVMPFQTSERGHLGLGIYYAKRVVTALRGSLEFHFSEENGTLQTRLSLPLEA